MSMDARESSGRSAYNKCPGYGMTMQEHASVEFLSDRSLQAASPILYLKRCPNPSCHLYLPKSSPTDALDLAIHTKHHGKFHYCAKSRSLTCMCGDRRFSLRFRAGENDGQ
jgi:hypothetical protein